jgi:DNA polymerase III epsilon subunit-like protein
MPKHYSALPQHNGNLICAVDIETTGADSDKHEIIQVAFVPLNTEYEMLDTVRPFYMDVKPLTPETAEPAATRVHGLDLDDLVATAPHPDRVLEKFYKWYTDLELAFERKLIMLAHNASFENKFLNKWFGPEYYEKVFNACTRDSMEAAITVNDHAVRHGRRPPFERTSLPWLCEHFGINNPKAHDAFADATAGALVYRNILDMDMLL